MPVCAVELADIDDFGADRAVEHRIGRNSRPGDRSGSRSCRSFVRLHLVGDAGEAFVAPKQRKHIKNPRRGRAPGEGGAERLGKLAELDAARPRRPRGWLPLATPRPSSQVQQALRAPQRAGRALRQSAAPRRPRRSSSGRSANRKRAPSASSMERVRARLQLRHRPDAAAPSARRSAPSLGATSSASRSSSASRI